MHKFYDAIIAFVIGISLTVLSYFFTDFFFTGYEYNAWEFWGVVLNFACVLLVARQNIWTWPFGIAAVGLLGYLFWNIELYASLALHIAYFLPVQIWGWYNWAYGNKKAYDSLPVTSVSMLGWTYILAIAPLIYLGLSAVNIYFDGSAPFLDTGILVLSVIAQYLLGLKKVESWMFWIAVNVIAIAVYMNAGLHILGIQYIMFLGNAFYGLYCWYRQSNTAAVPA